MQPIAMLSVVMQSHFCFFVGIDARDFVGKLTIGLIVLSS
jgi:hypothetical protein